MAASTLKKIGTGQARVRVPRRELKRALRAAIKRDREEGGDYYYEGFFASSAFTLPATLVIGIFVAFGFGARTELIWIGMLPATIQGSLVVNYEAFVYNWRLKRGFIGQKSNGSTDFGELQAELIERRNG